MIKDGPAKQPEKEDPKHEPEKEEIIVIDNDYSYYVNFLNVDGSVLQRSIYKKGQTPSYNGLTPRYSDGVYSYTFTGWNKKISEVKSTQTYTAKYDVVKISDTHNHACTNYKIQKDGYVDVLYTTNKVMRVVKQQQ